jgi:F420H(2)-dependent quinone reductase
MGRVPAFDPMARKGPWFNFLAWSARQRPVTWFLIHVGNRIDPVMMKATGGRVRSTLNGPTVLLTHTGAKSGKKRTTPLAYFSDGDNVVLIASQGGAPKHPAWFHNVKANPDVELWTHGGGGRYRAREAEGELRDRLWHMATSFYPGYAKYQERTPDRRIPVVVCAPQDD